MSTIRKTITFTEKQDKWIKSQIKAGEFTNDSEYLVIQFQNWQSTL
jgi:antitoxin ParD1/3/4